ncbi:MAG: alanine--tRNA ligase [Actinobacteria bacterium]|nr:alanine--tRNA ligase [Cyanobacteriota bacterium]MCL6088350.1 alanine--tRNA ligase [Actinomycetota bacterium]
MDIRKEFIDYFRKNDHMILPSSGLIPDNDPSVLLTTAGMQQFKPYYLGIKKPPFPRTATVQKCFRTSDIDKIGDTDRHLTFFEMLGNFAFADYFKKEAINFALDFVLNVLKIPENRLWFTVFGGHKELPMDEEARSFWILNGINPDRIYKFGMHTNFWGPAGNTGPCGPSTEIYYDFGEKYGCGKSSCNPECECGRFIEIWNLVFTQYNYDGKNYKDLPNKNIDTGMGLERIYSTVTESASVYKTPLFNGIFNKLKEISGKEINYEKDNSYAEINKSLKIIADHSRAIYFLITDGVIPSNEGRGYILRRIIRRAIRFGKVLGINDFFLNEIGNVIVNDYKNAYPEIKEKKDFSFKIVSDEERKFSATLKEGMKVLVSNISALKSGKEKYLDSKDVFKLYDTYGFPVELTEEILKENKLSFDKDNFNAYLKNHQKISREKTTFNKKITENIDEYKSLAGKLYSEFSGYEKTEVNTKILHILKYVNNTVISANEISENDYGEIILENTPFYGEKGGEIGDRGIISSDDKAVFIVEDTQIPVEGIYIHKGFLKKGRLKVKDNVYAKIDAVFRKSISKNHTGTHLLHWALRSLYGKEVIQAGSLVTDLRIRFDYKFFHEPEAEMTAKIENLINKKIQDNDLVKVFETTKEYSEEIGAVSLFEDKYGKFVRVVEIGNYSRELCGGIHVRYTGELGVFKILQDFGIGSNLRRIEAVTGFNAIDYLIEKDNFVKKISNNLGVSEKDILKNIDILKTNLEDSNLKLEFISIKLAKSDVLKKYDGLFKDNDNKIIVFDFSKSDYFENLNVKSLGILSDEIKDFFKQKQVFISFASNINGKPVMIFNSSKDLVEKGVNCSVIARQTGEIIGGGGGGRPDFAQSGGSDPSRIEEAFDFIINNVKNTVN